MLEKPLDDRDEYPWMEEDPAALMKDTLDSIRGDNNYIPGIDLPEGEWPDQPIHDWESYNEAIMWEDAYDPS
jgi:hypothetical protein